MGWELTTEGLVIDGPVVRLLTALVAVPLTALGFLIVSVLFTASERLPDPPAPVANLEPVRELAATGTPLFADPASALADVGFFLAGILLLVGGALLFVKAVTDTELSVTIRSS